MKACYFTMTRLGIFMAQVIIKSFIHFMLHFPFLFAIKYDQSKPHIPHMYIPQLQTTFTIKGQKYWTLKGQTSQTHQM